MTLGQVLRRFVGLVSKSMGFNMQYSYSISVDTLTGQLDSSKLFREIDFSPIVTPIEQIDTSGNVMYISFSSALSDEEKTTLTGLVNAHDGSVPFVIEPEAVRIVEQSSLPAFADKLVAAGKLFRRKHGCPVQEIGPGETVTISLTVPYAAAKINKAEIVGCRFGDTVNLSVHDSVNGDYTTVPDYKLNQFGFNVVMPDGFYVDKSEYDADLYTGMQIKVDYTNNGIDAVLVGVNYTLHEVVPES